MKSTSGGFVTALSILILSLPAVCAATPARPMTPVDMVELTRLNNPSISPDGRYLLYLRSEVDWSENKERYRYRLYDLIQSERLAAPTAENPKESFKAGRWAPDSQSFLTILKRDADKFHQVYQFEVGVGELHRLTEHGSSIKQLVWAPDGTGFYFRAERIPSEAERKNLKAGRIIRGYSEKPFHELWFYDLAAKSSSPVIQGDFHVRSFRLSRRGNALLVNRTESALLDTPHGELWKYSITDTSFKKLTDNRYDKSKAQLSPDGKSFAYIATVNEKGEPYYEDNLFVHEHGATQPRLLFAEKPIEVLDFAWNDNGSGIYFLGNSGLRTQLYSVDLQNDSVVAITRGNHVVDKWRYEPGADRHVFLIRTEDSPGEVYSTIGTREETRQLSSEYAEYSNRFVLPEQRSFQWRGRGGQTLEGLLVEPLNYELGRRYPLVTITHGGPRSSSQFGSWNISRYVPVLAAQGYAVFLPNHRGGAGYGDRFLRDMVGGYFTNAHTDVLAGIDALVRTGLADPDQLIKMGWSAGGHMTNKLITVTDRFKAASSGAGVADWVSLYGESDIKRSRTQWFGGTPWQKRAPLRTFRKHSPVHDMWKLKTPVLFFSGSNDVRVPPTQAIMLYHAAKAAGVETELYIAPKQPHGFQTPYFRLFKINTELAWYARHLGREVFEPEIPTGAGQQEEADRDSP